MADVINAIRTMHAKDVISAKMASAYVTVGGERYLLFQAKSLEAKLEKEKSEVAILEGAQGDEHHRHGQHDDLQEHAAL